MTVPNLCSAALVSHQEVRKTKRRETVPVTVHALKKGFTITVKPRQPTGNVNVTRS